jgi:hypothetical protein
MIIFNVPCDDLMTAWTTAKGALQTSKIDTDNVVSVPMIMYRWTRMQKPVWWCFSYIHFAVRFDWSVLRCSLQRQHQREFWCRYKTCVRVCKTLDLLRHSRLLRHCETMQHYLEIHCQRFLLLVQKRWRCLFVTSQLHHVLRRSLW